jgi:hypothetical protein
VNITATAGRRKLLVYYPWYKIQAGQTEYRRIKRRAVVEIEVVVVVLVVMVVVVVVVVVTDLLPSFL